MRLEVQTGGAGWSSGETEQWRGEQCREGQWQTSSGGRRMILEVQAVAAVRGAVAE